MGCMHQGCSHVQRGEPQAGLSLLTDGSSLCDAQRSIEIFDGGATARYPDSYGCVFLCMFCTSLEADPENEPGSQACHLLLNVSPLLRCSPPLPRCCRRRFPPRLTHHRASGATVQQYGLLATKPAARAAAMSLRDTMGPVRD